MLVAAMEVNRCQWTMVNLHMLQEHDIIFEIAS